MCHLTLAVLHGARYFIFDNTLECLNAIKSVIKASRDLAWLYVTFQELKYGAKSNTRSSFNTVQSLNVPSAH